MPIFEACILDVCSLSLSLSISLQIPWWEHVLSPLWMYSRLWDFLGGSNVDRICVDKGRGLRPCSLACKLWLVHLWGMETLIVSPPLAWKKRAVDCKSIRDKTCCFFWTKSCHCAFIFSCLQHSNMQKWPRGITTHPHVSKFEFFFMQFLTWDVNCLSSVLLSGFLMWAANCSLSLSCLLVPWASNCLLFLSGFQGWAPNYLLFLFWFPLVGFKLLDLPLRFPLWAPNYLLLLSWFP